MNTSHLARPGPDEQLAHHRLAAQLAGVHVPEFVLPAHHHAVLGGLRLHYVDWGSPDRPPMIFLHGGGQTARTWDLPCLAMRREWHCLAVDQRGHGDSEWSYGYDYSFDAHARDTAALLDHLRIERAILVGMSMGCINALQFAVDFPDRIAAFVAVDAGPWIQFEGGKRIASFMQDTAELETLEAYVEHALAFNPRRDRRLLRTSLLHNLRQQADGTLSWKGDRRRPVDLGWVKRNLEGLRGRAGEVRCPTLILRGAQSDVFHDADAAAFAEAVPDARWVRIPAAGHVIQGDQPAALVAAIREFLHGIEAAPAEPRS